MELLPDTANLVILCRIYQRVTGLSESRVADKVSTNPYLFLRLRDGKGCTVRTYNRVLQWFSDNWPENLPWPADIPRPEPRVKEGVEV